jgi:hypothetical protein
MVPINAERWLLQIVDDAGALFRDANRYVEAA